MKYNIISFIRYHHLLRSLLRKIYKLLNKKSDNNVVVLIKLNGKKVYNPRIKNFKVKFSGKNNYIEIKEPFNIINKLYIQTEGSCNTVKIDRNLGTRKLTILLGENNTVEIGKRLSAYDLIIHLQFSVNKTIKIGNDCMFSYNIAIRTSDSHTIYDMNTKELLNHDKDTLVGNHVWVAQRALILKGARIPDNCVIGAGSIVTKKFMEENCIIAGVPAKVVKHGINWNACKPKEWEIIKQKYI